MIINSKLLILAFLLTVGDNDADASLIIVRIRDLYNINLATSTVFKSLKLLIECGFIKERIEERTAIKGRGRPPKRFFSITESGKKWFGSEMLKYRRAAQIFNA